MKMKKIAQRVRRVTRPGRNASETQEEEALVQEEALQDDEAGFEGEDDFEDEDYDQGSVADLDDYDGGSDDDDHQGADKGRDEEDVEEGVEDELKDLGVRARWKVQKALREIVRGAKEIYLERTSIGDAGANVLAKAVAQSKTLEILNLDSNDIHDAGAIELAKAVATNKTLTSLDLRSNRIGSEGAKALAGSLAASRTLTTMNLWNNNIGDEGVKALAGSLAASRTLTTLNLWNNNIGDEGAEALAGSLAASRTLTTLHLRSNRIGSEGAKALAASLAASRTLTTLNLWNNKIGDEGAKALAASLAASRTLTTLDLRSNKIGDEGAEALAGSLAANRTLTTLNLEGNDIGSEGAEALAGSLAASRTLTTLNLGENDIGSEGVKALAGSLAASRMLTTLHLGSNKIGDEGAEALAGSLAASRTLTTLHLERNDIGSEGAEALAGSLAASRTLIALNLGSNKIGDEGAEALAGSLAASRTLTTLHLEFNNIGDEGAKALADSLAVNNTLTSIESNKIGTECYERLARLLDENFTLTSLIFDMPDIPSPLSFGDLWARKVGEAEDGEAICEPLTRSERVQEIGEYLVEESGSRWTTAAHKLASKHAHIFVIFLSMLAAHDPDALSLNDFKLWLQHDEKEEDDDAVPIIHALLDCRPGGTKFALPEAFLQEFITGKLPLKDGLALMATEDNIGRSARSLALANKNTKGWAQTYGTYLERYSIAEGPPVHESKTCAVHLATDIRTNTPVAIKIMRERKQYDREIEARETKDGSQLQGCLKLLDRDSKNDRKLLDKEMCLVMPRGSRSLFEAINTERFAGRDLDKIREISYQIALALQNLHVSGRIHGDIKPRNAVRTSASSANTFEDSKKGRQMVSKDWRDSPTGEGLDREEEWELIDLDASVVIGDEVSEKASTGYVSPEVARCLFEGDERPKGATSQDVWGFGVLLYQLLSGTKLFMVDESDDNLVHDHDKRKLMNWLGLDEDRMKRIKKRKAARGAEDGLSGSESEIEAARDLARVCLRGKAKERLAFENILVHPFFDKILESKLDSSSQAAEDPSRRESRKKHKSRSRRASGRTSGPKPKPTRLSRHLSQRAKIARPMKDRIVSIHRNIKDMNSRFDSIRKTLRLSQRNEQKYHKWYHEPALRTDLLELPTYHFFLSHMQQQAAGIVKDLEAGLERNQMTAWVDMRALEITMGAMQRGVMSSQCFVMVLTTDVLFRPFCLAELKFAVDHFVNMEGGLSKHIFFLAEEDERFSPWRAIEDEPWTRDTLENEDERSLKAQAKKEMERATKLQDDANEADDEDLAISYKREAIQARNKAKELKCRLARRKLEEGLSSALFDLGASVADDDDDISVHESADNYKEYFDAAQRALEECYIIPYRRRQFEEEAMLRELARLAGFKTRAPVEPRAVPKLYVLGMAESLVIPTLKKALESESSMNAAEVVVIVLEPGCCPAVHGALGIESIDEDNELLKSKKFLAVENGWNFGGKEREQFHVDLQKKLFDHLEALSWHGSHEGDFSATSMESVHEGIPRRNYREEHELEALILELQLRACRLVEDWTI